MDPSGTPRPPLCGYSVNNKVRDWSLITGRGGGKGLVINNEGGG